MKLFVVLLIFCYLQLMQSSMAEKISSANFFNQALQGLGTALQVGTMPYTQGTLNMPPVLPYSQGTSTIPSSGMQPTLYQRKQAEATVAALKNEEAVTDLNKQARNIEDTYKQIEQEISGPLQSQTASLKQQRDMILKRLSVLTKLLRTEYDFLYKDRTNLPIVIIAQNHDDEMRAEVNQIDSNGLVDVLKGISSPCAAFHKSREAQEKSLDASTDNNLDIELETLNKMKLDERLNYDTEMAKQSEREAKEIEREIKAAEKEEKMMQKQGMIFPTFA